MIYYNSYILNMSFSILILLYILYYLCITSQKLYFYILSCSLYKYYQELLKKNYVLRKTPQVQKDVLRKGY